MAFGRQVERAGYGLILSPVFEEAGVFVRGMGEGTDVVSKEMYEFRDKGDRHLALRPEGTASVVRAFVQHRPPVVWKAWYVTPAFRYERPQAGRYRQHHQLGVEALGTEDPDLDVEVVTLASRLFGELGLSRVELKVNSMGDANCRPAYLDLLRTYLDAHRDELCDQHRERYSANPLRVLDCKDERCVRVTENAPRLLRLALRCVPQSLRPRASGVGGPRCRVHDRPPAGARLRLLHTHGLRVRRPGARGGPERDRRRRSL